MAPSTATLHYRAYLPTGIGATVGAVLVTVLIPLHWLALQAGVSAFLATPAVGLAAILVPNVFLARDVQLSGDGRLTITGFGQRKEIDVRHLTEIHVSTAARRGFGFARVHWNGGGFRLWQSLTYLPNPRRRHRKRSSGVVTEDFRDLVYRLHLINPSMTIRGVTPPAWARPRA